MLINQHKKLNIVGLIFSIVFLAACERDFENPVNDSGSYTKGTADFTTFVSVGDSLTAGYRDNALYLEGQQHSLPAILAQQFTTVGGGDFTQPLVSDNLGGLLINGATNSEFPNRLVLNATPKAPPLDLDPTGPEPIAGDPTTEVLNILTGPFNNVGVPGAKTFHLTSTSYGDPTGIVGGTANPYYVRFATATDASVITDAAAQQATFFTFWVGNNDVLSFATAGGAGTDQTGNTDPTSYGSTDITDPAVFASVYSQLVGAMTTANPDAKGVLINIPDISTLPYFTTVPHNPVPLDATTAETLNTAYADYNAGVQAALGLTLITQEEADKRTVTFSAGLGNAVVIIDESLSDITAVDADLVKIRQATGDDLLVLSTGSKIGTLADEADPNSAWGLGVPLADGDVLIPAEIEAINTAQTAFNASIKAVADADDDLLLLDAAALLTELQSPGINFGTGYIDATYATGGGFSLDGVHPTGRAYAVIANRIINEINSSFGANIPPVDPGTYPTIFVK